MNYLYKTVSTVLVLVFLICSMIFIGSAENKVKAENVSTDKAVTTADPVSEVPEHSSENYSEQSGSIANRKTTINTGIYTQTYKAPTTKKSAVAKTYRNNNNNVTAAFGDVTKTTKSTKATTATTTVAKNISDFSQKFRVIKWIALVLMILSLGGLILINTRNAMNKPRKKGQGKVKYKRKK